MTEPIRPDDMRVSDIERARTQDRLRRAHDSGQLDLTEFDERVTAVWAARTRGDLRHATADLSDLPAPPPAPGPLPMFSTTGAGTTMRVLMIVWAGIVAVNFSVWAILSLTVGGIYPWWIWVAVPSGAVLAVLYAAGIGRPPRRPE